MITVQWVVKYKITEVGCGKGPLNSIIIHWLYFKMMIVKTVKSSLHAHNVKSTKLNNDSELSHENCMHVGVLEL